MLRIARTGKYDGYLLEGHGLPRRVHRRHQAPCSPGRSAAIWSATRPPPHVQSHGIPYMETPCLLYEPGRLGIAWAVTDAEKGRFRSFPVVWRSRTPFDKFMW